MRRGVMASAAFLLIGGAVSAAQAKNVADVIGLCQDQRPFPQYAACVKSTYAAKGELRNSGPVLAFFAYFDELVENFEKSQSTADPMSEARARAETMRIWQATIDADDKARRAATGGRTTSCTPAPNGGMTCTRN